MEDLFEKYIHQQLSSTDLAEFESRLAADPALRVDLDNYRKEVTGVQAYFLKKHLEALHETIENPKPQSVVPPSRSSKFWWWLVLGLGALFSAIYYIYQYTSTEDTPKEELIFAELYQPAQGLPTTMSTTDQFEFLRGMVDYKTKNFQAAWERWSRIDTSNDTLHYYQAIAAIELQKDTESYALFEKLLNKDLAFVPESEWYMALLDIRARRHSQAMTRFQKIAATPNHPYKKQAIRALEMMK